jgi:pilus assembly protein Flp/PilA
MSAIYENCRGATAVEYGLIAALISIAAIGGLLATGDNIVGMYTQVADAIAGALR